MFVYQTGPPPVLGTGVSKIESVPAVSHRVIDGLFVFALVIVPMVAMLALLFLLGSADPTTAVPTPLDGTGMLILPP